MDKIQLQYILNSSTYAFLSVNRYGIIEQANERAEEVFGVNKNNNHVSFASDSIKKNDLVVYITDNFGISEGDLTSEDLSTMGIKGVDISKGSSIIAIGCYKNEEIEPVLKCSTNPSDNILQVETYFMGININIVLTAKPKKFKIKIGANQFQNTNPTQLKMMLIFNGMDNKVKYYSQGESPQETFKNVLSGLPYKGKKDFYYIPNLTNCQLTEAIGENIISKKILAAIKNTNFSNEEDSIFLNNSFIHYWLYKTKTTEDGDFKIILKMVNIMTCYSETLTWIDEIATQQINLNAGNKNDYIHKFSGIIGSSSEIMNVKYMANRAAQSNSTVIIYGESGTGKSLLAKMIHKNSKYASMPFVEVNCASIPETLAESEFFGYEKGAFTGAVTNGKKGFFELAQNGTIFLDEIGELTLAMQAKLLEVMQNRSFYKVGGIKKIAVNTRIIIATNKNLKELIKEGRFREDLYYRINVLPITLPPLRERKCDINRLAQKLLRDICNRLNVELKVICKEALSKILEYDWPGNIRELENVLEAAVNLCENNIIQQKDLLINDVVDNDHKSLKQLLEEVEKEIIQQQMLLFQGDKKKVMENLNIGRSNLFSKLKKYNIKNP